MWHKDFLFFGTSDSGNGRNIAKSEEQKKVISSACIFIELKGSFLKDTL